MNSRRRVNSDVRHSRLFEMQYTVFADYFQFYLQDELADGNLSDAWTEQAVKELLAIAPGTIGVGTVRNMDIPVDIEIVEETPTNDPDDWDHIMECGIDLPSPACHCRLH